MNTPALDFTQAHQITTQANAEENTLINQGTTVYNQQMALSKAATVQGNQDIAQAKVANQNANIQTQKASNEAKIMANSGASGKLFQQDLSSQFKITGYNPQTLAHNQELQNQTAGLEKTALNQLDNVMGGNRGLSAAGVQAKVQSITTQSNNLETSLGLSIQNELQAQTTADTQASNEATTQFKKEQQAQTSYKDSAAQYVSQAKSYNQAAKSEYNSSSNYAADATNSMVHFMIAAYHVANVALTAAHAKTTQAFNYLAQQQTGYTKSETAFANSETAFKQQTNAFNKQQDAYHIAAAKAVAKADSNNFTIPTWTRGAPKQTSNSGLWGIL